MAWGAVIGGALSYMGAQKQAGQMDRATGRSIDLQREQFDYARSLQEALMQQQEPRRQSSQRAMRSLSSILGLGDPGPSAPIYQQQKLTSLQDQLAGMDKFQTTVRPAATGVNLAHPAHGGIPLDDPRRGGTTVTETVNPEYTALQEEIAALEAELSSGEGFEDDFDPAQDITELPGYQFMQEQGLDALASSGAARGMQLSGAQMEDISRFGQGLASQYRGQLIGELQSMAGMRPSTAPVSNLGNLAIGEGQAIGDLLQQQGAIGAAETAGTYGSLAATMGQIPWGQMGGQTTTQSPVGGPMGYARGAF